jgi:putative radical SAM enzyme (TIGR03279 family)
VIAVKLVEQGTLAERAGFREGDRILRVNDTIVKDLIDFQVACADERLVFEVEREDERYEVEVERDEGEALGFDFDEMRLRSCNNKCVFCFLHQMPPGMRRSLYFEDDDYRLSFLHGSYVTLTNIKTADLERMVEQGLTPQYISVHATDPELRDRLLGRKQESVPILERIDYLARNGIEMHAQVVICPGWNDGVQLQRTVHDLHEFYPSVRSVALVPLGLTRFRSHLPQLECVTPDLARQYVAAAEQWGATFQREHGERFVYPGDELFLMTGRMPPTADYYDAFPQIENGIGMVRTFLDTWERGRTSLQFGEPGQHEKPLHLALLTGVLAASFLEPMIAELKNMTALQIDVVPIANDFFGHGITVSGLLTAQDIIRALQGGPWDLAVLPPNAINGDGLTLDDATVADIEERSGVPVTVGEYDLVQSLRRCLDDHGTNLSHGQGRQLSELGFFVGRKS